MRFIGRPIVSRHPLGQLSGGEQAVRLNNIALTVDPFGFNRVEPGTLCGQKQGQNTHTLLFLLDLNIMLTNPGAYYLALMPRGIVPNQQPCGLPLFLQLRTTPLQKLGRHVTDWSSSDKAQRHLLTDWIRSRPFLPENAIAGQRFGIRIALLPRLFHQMDGMILVLPSMHTRQGKATPPNLIFKSDSPGRLLAGPSDQAVTGLFF